MCHYKINAIHSVYFFLSSCIVTQLSLPCIYFANMPETFLHFPTFFPMSSLELALVAVYAKEVHSNLWAAIYRKNKASKCNFLIAASHTRFCTEQTGDHVEFFFLRSFLHKLVIHLFCLCLAL